MYGYVLLSLMMTLVAMDLARGAPAPAGGPVLTAMAALAVVVLVAGLALGSWIARHRDRVHLEEQRFLRRAGLLGKLYRLLVVAVWAGMLFGLGWPALAGAWAPLAWDSVRFGVTLLPLPGLWLLSWVALHRADRRLREVMFERLGVLVRSAQWTLARYVVFRLRQYVLVILVPLFVFLSVQDAAAAIWGWPHGGPAAVGLVLAMVVAAALLAGVWLRVCWSTEVMPGGDLRARLEALSDRSRVRVGDILVWRTNVTIANGCMVGLVGPLRYIMITDALMLSQPNEEIEAVFAHEVAHAKYHHVAMYMVLALGGVGVATLILEGVTLAAHAFGYVLTQEALIGLLAASVLGYWWLVFGFISRRCELECDLYAVRATSCPVGCSPPDTGARASRGSLEPDAPRGLCEHRVGVFTSALRRISRLNGSAETSRGWRHFSVARRCRFLERVLADPAKGVRFERRVRLLKAGALGAAVVVVGLAAGVFVLAWALASGPDDPEHPAGPEDGRPEEATYLVRLVDGHQMDRLSLRPPELHRDADPPAQSDDRRLPRLRPEAPVADDDVAVADAGDHAVAVDAQAEKVRLGPLQPRQVHELGHPLGRRLAELDEHGRSPRPPGPGRPRARGGSSRSSCTWKDGGPAPGPSPPVRAARRPAREGP